MYALLLPDTVACIQMCASSMRPVACGCMDACRKAFKPAGTERLCKYIFRSVQLVSQLHHALSTRLLLNGKWIRETQEVPFLLVSLRALLFKSELLLGADSSRAGLSRGKHSAAT